MFVRNVYLKPITKKKTHHKAKIMAIDRPFTQVEPSRAPT